MATPSEARPQPGNVCSRYEFLSRYLRRHPHLGPDDLLALLNDVNVRQDITAQHVLASPARAMFRLFVPVELLEHDQSGDDFASMRKLF